MEKLIVKIDCFLNINSNDHDKSHRCTVWFVWTSGYYMPTVTHDNSIVSRTLNGIIYYYCNGHKLLLLLVCVVINRWTFDCSLRWTQSNIIMEFMCGEYPLSNTTLSWYMHGEIRKCYHLIGSRRHQDVIRSNGHDNDILLSIIFILFIVILANISTVYCKLIIFNNII